MFHYFILLKIQKLSSANITNITKFIDLFPIIISNFLRHNVGAVILKSQEIIETFSFIS